MKILQVNCVFRKGSTGKITEDIHNSLLERGIDSIVCYGRGDRIKEKNVHKVCSEFVSKVNHFFTKLTGVLYGGIYPSTKRIVNLIKKQKPDVVHLQCINGFFVNVYSLVKWLKTNGIKTVLTLHAEFMYTGGCGLAYDCEQWKEKCGCKDCPRWKIETGSFVNRIPVAWKKMMKVFDGFNDTLSIVSVSPWLQKRAEQSTVLKGKRHYTVLNGLNDDIFTYSNEPSLRKKHGITDEKIVFHASPYFDESPTNVKGGRHVLALAKRFENKGVKFIVAGKSDPNMKVPSNVILLGEIKDQKTLALYYSMADVTLLTSERETFSMVTAESLCCGTPVVGFNAGAPEVIAIKKFSRFCEYGNVDLLEEELSAVLQTDFGKKEEISSESRAKYSKKVMTENYLRIYEELIDKR